MKGNCGTKKPPYVGSTKDLHKRHANHKNHANNHKIGSKFQCKLTEHLVLEHGGFVEPEFLKFMAIDTIMWQMLSNGELEI